MWEEFWSHFLKISFVIQTYLKVINYSCRNSVQYLYQLRVTFKIAKPVIKAKALQSNKIVGFSYHYEMLPHNNTTLPVLSSYFQKAVIGLHYLKSVIAIHKKNHAKFTANTSREFCIHHRELFKALGNRNWFLG